MQGPANALGFAGWDKVDKLAQALFALSVLSIPTSQASNIVVLFDNLEDHEYHSLATDGRFGKSKGGHVTLDLQKKIGL